MKQNNLMSMKFLIILAGYYCFCSLAFGEEAEKPFLLQEFNNLPKVDISKRKSWHHQINDSERYRYANERWKNFFHGDIAAIKVKLSKLTLSDKYVIFEVSWRNGGKNVFDCVFEEAKETDINLEKDTAFSLGVKNDFINFAKWMVLDQEKTKKADGKWMKMSDVEKYKKMLAALSQEFD